LTELLRLTYF